MTRILVNGVPTQALVDTGSPATIISLDFVIDIFTKERKKEQTPAQWKEATWKRFSQPAILLRAYSGHKLNIMVQVSLRLTHGSRTVEAMVLVQEGAPNEFLLGTDLQPKLGFALVAEKETMTSSRERSAPRLRLECHKGRWNLVNQFPVRVKEEALSTALDQRLQRILNRHLSLLTHGVRGL